MGYFEELDLGIIPEEEVLQKMIASAPHLRESVPQVLDFLLLMDGGIFSCGVNVMKPDREIYGMLCERYHLKPEECVFIDDRSENVAAAKEVGMAAVVFDGAWCARMKKRYAAR